MSDGKPEFDPTQPFSAVKDPSSPDKPAFDPSQPYDPVDIGPVEAFGRAAANNVPLVPQAIASLSDGDYSKNLEEWNAKAGAAKDENPISYGAGAVTGAAAPMLIPGVGEAFEASPILTGAGFGAAGAVSNEDIKKNPIRAIKEALKGAAIGGGTAGLVKGITPEAGTMENIAESKAIQSLEMPSGILVNMSPEERSALGQFARSNDLVGRNKEEVLKKARELLDQYGSKIGELGERSEELGLHINPDEHYKVVQTLLDKADEYGGLANREARGLARNYKAGANDILNLPDNPSWADVQKLKSQYGGLAFKSNGEVKDDAAKDTYFALKDMLKSIAAKAHANPNMPSEYKQALAGYSQMHPIVSGLEKAVDAELRGASAPMSHHIPRLVAHLPGPVRAVAGTAAALTGHPVIAGAAALPEVLNPANQSNVAAWIARQHPKLRSGLSQEIIDYVNSQKKERTPQ